MYVTPPPVSTEIINEEGKITVQWASFFSFLVNSLKFVDAADSGTVFTPSFENLYGSGTPTVSGIFYRLTRNFVFFRVVIVPGTNITSKAGDTYIKDLPFTINGDGVCFAVAGGVGTNAGHVDSENQRIYTPEFLAVTTKVTIVGFAEAT